MSILSIFLKKKTHYFRTESIARIESKTGQFYLGDAVMVYFVDGNNLDFKIEEKMPLEDIFSIFKAYGIPDEKLRALKTLINVKKKNSNL